MYVDLFNRKVKGQPYFAELTLHCIIGQMPSVKKMRIRFGDNEIDLRVSVCVFKPVGNDCGYGIDFMSGISKAIGINYEAITKTEDVINLIGLNMESHGYDPKKKKTTKIVTANRGVLDPTPEDGREIAHIIGVNNAEVLIKSTGKLFTGITGCYEKTLKTIGTDGNKVISEWHKRPNKNPTDGNFKNRIEFHPDCSLMFVSRPPDNFLKAIEKCPMLQTMTILYNEYSTKDMVRVAKEYTRLLGVDDSTEDDLKDLIQRLKHVDKHWHIHWKDKITIEPDAITKIESIIKRIFDRVNKVDEAQRDSLESFAQHWIQQVWRIAWHRMILRLDTTVIKSDVEFAEKFLWPVWKRIITLCIAPKPKYPHITKEVKGEKRDVIIAMQVYQDLCRQAGVSFGAAIPRSKIVHILTGSKYWERNYRSALRYFNNIAAKGWFKIINRSRTGFSYRVIANELPSWMKEHLKDMKL